MSEHAQSNSGEAGRGTASPDSEQGDRPGRLLSHSTVPEEAAGRRPPGRGPCPAPVRRDDQPGRELDRRTCGTVDLTGTNTSWRSGASSGPHGPPFVPVAVLSRKIAAQFCTALKAAAPAVFADIPAGVWQREWVSFCKHYGHGNDAVLSYLSRYVFRTAKSNARILGMDVHVPFRLKDRSANGWCTGSCRSVDSAGSSFSTSCRKAFTRSDTTGSGTPRSETSPIVPGCF